MPIIAKNQSGRYYQNLFRGCYATLNALERVKSKAKTSVRSLFINCYTTLNALERVKSKVKTALKTFLRSLVVQGQLLKKAFSHES